MLISMSTFEQNAPSYMFDSFGYVDFFTYIRLHEEAKIEDLAAKMPEFYANHQSSDEIEVDLRRDYAFENIRDAYFSPTGGSLTPGPTGNPANLMIFSAIAIFILLIACVNYMNLSTARSSERAKEIGIRKVLGASIADILQLLIWQFSKPVLAANIFAWPVAGYYMIEWLSQYPNRLESPWVGLFCIAAGLVALMIAWITVGSQAYKVARKNPIHALRYE